MPATSHLPQRHRTPRLTAALLVIAIGSAAIVWMAPADGAAIPPRATAPARSHEPVADPAEAVRPPVQPATAHAAGPAALARPTAPFAPASRDLLGSEDDDEPARAAWPMLGDSLANRQLAMQSGVHAVSVRGLGLPRLSAGEGDSPAGLQVAADLRRNGRFAVFALVPEAGEGALAYVLEPDAQGRWHDRSAALLGEGLERRFCERPLRVLAADFNGDTPPDLFVACEGGRQWLLASTPRGGLARIALDAAVPATLEAADADGDGRIDLVDAAGWWLPGLDDGHFATATSPSPAPGMR